MNKSHNIKILVACHKPVEKIRNDDIYMPVHVGKALHPELNLGFQGDDTGINISHKNETFCELTGLYWAWKNLKDVDYIGLCHYRRYFNFTESKNIAETFFNPESREDRSKETDILRKHLLDNKVILPGRDYFRVNLFEAYSHDHFRKDIVKTYDVIKSLNFPKEYSDAFISTLNNNRMATCNMFVMPWECFDEFCNFIFPVLFELERQTDLSGYDSYQKRIFGFISERLFNVFINRKDFGRKKKEVPVFNTEVPGFDNFFHNSPLCKRNRQFLLSRHEKFIPN